MRYYSKRDLWLTLTLWGTVLVPLILITNSIIKDDIGNIEAMFIISILIITDAFIVWLWFSTYYVIKKDELLISYGPFKKVIQLNSIQLIQKTSNPLSGPALSIKRIEIMYEHYNITLISPEDRDYFISLLLEKCPNAKLKT